MLSSDRKSLGPWTRATSANSSQISRFGKRRFISKLYLVPGLVTTGVFTLILAILFRRSEWPSAFELLIAFVISAFFICGWSLVLGIREWSRAIRLSARRDENEVRPGGSGFGASPDSL